jgi:hypothetical protein
VSFPPQPAGTYLAGQTERWDGHTWTPVCRLGPVTMPADAGRVWTGDLAAVLCGHETGTYRIRAVEHNAFTGDRPDLTLGTIQITITH